MKKILAVLLVCSSVSAFAQIGDSPSTPWRLIITNNTDKDMNVVGDNGLFINNNGVVKKQHTNQFNINQELLATEERGMAVEFFPTDSVRLSYMYNFSNTESHFNYINWLIAPEKASNTKISDNGKEIHFYFCEKEFFKQNNNSCITK